VGIVFGLVAAAVIIGGVILGAVLASKSGQQTDMSPASFEDLNITQASEGSVVPIVYGRVRLTGNIIWYGNLKSKAIKESSGGKGGGSDKVVVGYEYKLDVWQAVCRGVISWIGTYVQDDEKTVTADTTLTNDGSQETYPTYPGSNANRLPGVAHTFYRRMLLGENVTNVPTVHYVVERDMSSSGVTNHTLSNGTNAHAIIYDILIEAGAHPTQINTSSFNTAGSYWYNKGYGLNIIFNKQSKAKEKINRVLSYVDGAFGPDHENKFRLKAFNENDSSVDTIDNDDWLEFQFDRKTWNDTYNEFRGNFIDASKDYSKRTVIVRNPANAALQGRKRPMSVDLTAFRDEDTASKRLWEIMKKQSYPFATIKGSTTLKFWEVNIGDIVTVNKTEYGISGAEFRILEKDVSEVDKNVIGWEMEQFSETLFDSNYESGGGSWWVPVDTDPSALTHQSIFELPYNPLTGSDRAYLLLAAREHDFEVGWETLFSTTGSDYSTLGTYTGWSQYGTLDEEYADTTKTIDDEVGILYTPYRDDPEFESSSRTDLFATSRYALMGTEIVKFQTVTAEGSSSYRLTGVIRGMFNTTVAIHSASSGIWLFELTADAILTGITSGDFYLKYLPYYGGEKVSAGSVTPIHVTTIYNRAQKPWVPTAIRAVRSGSDVTLTIYTTTQFYDGAGKQGETAQLDYTPTSVDDQLEVYDSDEGSGASQLLTSGTDTRSKAGAFTYYARQVNGTYKSSWVSVYIDTADGRYWS
jgi:hypothetical protein